MVLDLLHKEQEFSIGQLRIAYPFICPPHVGHHVFPIIDFYHLNEVPILCNHLIEFFCCCPTARAIRKQDMASFGSLQHFSYRINSDKATMLIPSKLFKNGRCHDIGGVSSTFGFPENLWSIIETNGGPKMVVCSVTNPRRRHFFIIGPIRWIEVR